MSNYELWEDWLMRNMKKSYKKKYKKNKKVLKYVSNFQKRISKSETLKKIEKNMKRIDNRFILI